MEDATVKRISEWMHFLWLSPLAGLESSGCTVGPGAAGSRGSGGGSVEAHVPGSGR